jgi:hypothetical protein
VSARALAFALAVTCAVSTAAAEPPQALRAAPGGRHLETTDGRPFFLLGDTAWSIFHKTRHADVERYLAKRGQQGFNTVWASLTAAGFWPGLGPNAFGEPPFEAGDPLRPNEAFFLYADWVIDRAGAAGLHVALLPTWGEYVCPAWQDGPKIFDAATARGYGRWLGRRYSGRRHLIWVLGGDRRPDECEPGDVAVWRALASGLLEGLDRAPGEVVMTYHPRGGAHSSTLLHGDAWLVFDAFQSSHCADSPSYDYAARDAALLPRKPTLDAEPVYENIPSCLEAGAPRIDARAVRKAAWWSALAGAAGHVYGASEVFSFWRPGEPARDGWFATPWTEALEYPGAAQMGVLRRFLEARPWTRLERAPALLRSANGPGDAHVEVARAADGSFLVAYLASSRPIGLDTSALAGDALAAAWLDPRTGARHAIGAVTRARDWSATPPAGEPHEDWVLVIEPRDE